MLLSKFFARASLTFFFSFSTGSSLYAVSVQSPVYVDTKIVAFESDESHLYFIPPFKWTLKPQGGYRTVWTEALSDGTYDLRLVIAPSYENSLAWMIGTQNAAPQSVFFPVPASIDETILFLPPELGLTQAELTPESSGSLVGGAYYRLNLTGEQLSMMRTSATSGLTLQGAVNYSFEREGTFQQTSSPITLFLNPNDLLEQSVAVEPTRWLTDLLDSNELYLVGINDGSYSLGGFISVNLQNSKLQGHFLPNSYELQQAQADRISLISNGLSNFTGRYSVEIAELGTYIELDVESAISLNFNPVTIEVSVDSVDIKKVTLNGQGSKLYADFLKKHLAGANVQKLIAKEMSRELQKRILNQTLFGI